MSEFCVDMIVLMDEDIHAQDLSASLTLMNDRLFPLLLDVVVSLLFILVPVDNL